MRQGFNQLAETRLLSRLRAIPALVAKQLVRPQDIWAEQLYLFDHTVRASHRVLFRVSDLLACGEVADTVAAIRQEVGRLDGRYEASEIWVGADSAVGAQLVKPDVRGDKVRAGKTERSSCPPKPWPTHASCAQIRF